jgi:tetratricopeptide (TPR) repeat protein
MKKIFILSLLFSVVALSQTYKVEKVSGIVKALTNGSDKWIEIKSGTELSPNSIISVEKNSSVKISNGSIAVTLKELSAVTISSIKQMSTEDLLLALAMENILNAPKKPNDNKSQSTAVYGKNEMERNPLIAHTEFGIRRLNGAMQLAENGLKESAIISAKEVYRKYPDTKSLVSYRIFFADILFDKKLFEEALDEYNDILKLQLSNEQKEKVTNRIDEIKRRISIK